MIVCSQTCFLNVLTQLYPKDVLVDATYYIADVAGPGGIGHSFTNEALMYADDVQYKYNEDGQIVQVGNPVSTTTLQKYHVHYTSGTLNPISLLTSQRISLDRGRTITTPEDRFIASLQQPTSASEVYNDIFYHPLRGNGLQILIYTDDDICCQFGWITCEYLSQCFGADIIYLDAIYRKKIAPQSKQRYIGNKKYASETFIPAIRDRDLLEGFRLALTHSSYRDCLANVTSKLNSLHWAQLIRLYQMIWTNDPLPAGNYSEEQLKEIIIYKLMGDRKPTVYDNMDNLYAADMFYDIANEYDE